MLEQSFPYKEIQQKLEQYCAFQERCHLEVSQKLKEYGINGNPMYRIISHLIEQNYLNETRFAEHFVRGKFNIKKWGKKRLLRELKQRNISDWNIKNAMKEILSGIYSSSLGLYGHAQTPPRRMPCVVCRR